MAAYKQIYFFFQTTLTPEEYKGHTSDPCSPDMCGFPAPGKPGSEPPGPAPTQTTVSLNRAPANAAFWHFAATGKYPLVLKPHQWLRFIHCFSCSFLHLISSLAKRISISPAQTNQRQMLCDIISCYLGIYPRGELYKVAECPQRSWKSTQQDALQSFAVLVI